MVNISAKLRINNILSVSLVNALLKIDLVNDNSVDNPIDRRVLNNAEAAIQRYYHLRRPSEY